MVAVCGIGSPSRRQNKATTAHNPRARKSPPLRQRAATKPNAECRIFMARATTSRAKDPQSTASSDRLDAPQSAVHWLSLEVRGSLGLPFATMKSASLRAPPLGDEADDGEKGSRKRAFACARISGGLGFFRFRKGLNRRGLSPLRGLLVHVVRNRLDSVSSGFAASAEEVRLNVDRFGHRGR